MRKCMSKMKKGEGEEKTFSCLPKIVIMNASIPLTQLRVSIFGFSSRVRST